MMNFLIRKIFGTKNERELNKFWPVVEEINLLEESISKLSDDDLKKKTEEFKERLNKGETLDDLLKEAFAVVREVSVRTIGLRHFDVQLIGGICLHQGKIAEMRTGEGKTLSATLPIYLNSLTGKGSHVVTVNDYLSKRDSEWMAPIYKFLGLSVGNVQGDMDQEDKREAYLKDVTYVTNNELGFDYLRDNMVTNKKDRVLRPLNYAIIDEVDSILVDEARTPLIISGPAEESTDKYSIINKLVPRLNGRFVTEAEEIDAKYKNIDLSVGYDYLVDEKAGNVTLTNDGVSKCENMLGIKNLYDDIQSEWVHHITQALRAHNLFKRDVDYVVKDSEVIIVDEFTGRLMPGRRWSDGLHQAVEAKENVTIAEENQTLATVTFQNFFRMYNKLSGMTGTALTEAEEFWEIYKLDVLEIPTNQPMIRQDESDIIYRTEREKFEAIVVEIERLNKIGSPILVGTKSIEKSEKLSSMLKTKGIQHRVLNAKYHEMEATIISQAGRRGSVTIATNMAGRGTDIVLGGYPQNDEAYKEVIDFNGLHIVGTERHDSRRIDNQLRGRAGRQGDPGYSVFYLSLEDDIMRLFGATDRISGFMEKLGMEKGQDLQHPWLSRAIESAQRKVEGLNFDIRKQLLDYDNVMNKQREVAYAQRNLILDKEDLKEDIDGLLEDVCLAVIDSYVPEKAYPETWDLEGLNAYFRRLTGEDIENLESLRELIRDGVIQEFTSLLKDAYVKRQEKVGSDTSKYLQRVVMLQVIDSCWKDHLYNLDQVRKGIGLRAYAQKDPKIEYQQESFKLFMSMINRVKEETVEYLFKATVVQERSTPDFNKMMENDPSLNITQSTDNNVVTKNTNKPIQPVKKLDKIGRNDPCPCGSGKKYKKCCGK